MRVVEVHLLLLPLSDWLVCLALQDTGGHELVMQEQTYKNKTN
jgi:hypothetical protein